MKDVHRISRVGIVFFPISYPLMVLIAGGGYVTKGRHCLSPFQHPADIFIHEETQPSLGHQYRALMRSLKYSKSIMKAECHQLEIKNNL